MGDPSPDTRRKQLPLSLPILPGLASLLHLSLRRDLHLKSMSHSHVVTHTLPAHLYPTRTPATQPPSLTTLTLLNCNGSLQRAKAFSRCSLLAQTSQPIQSSIFGIGEHTDLHQTRRSHEKEYTMRDGVTNDTCSHI